MTIYLTVLDYSCLHSVIYGNDAPGLWSNVIAVHITYIKVTNPGTGGVIQHLRALPILPVFNSQRLHGDLQPSVSIVPEYLITSSSLHGHQTHKWYTDIIAKHPDTLILFLNKKLLNPNNLNDYVLTLCHHFLM